jgi:queuine tRNA-ribosyltransferase
MRQLDTPHGILALPIFLPDATRGVVRAVDSADLERCGITALVMNAFHLMQRPGSTTVKALGGLHAMCGWPHPIVTDSGGFQAYSLIRENPKNGTITDKGLVFRPQNGKDKVVLTPEKSIQLQMSYGADVLVCLDDCTNADDSEDVQRESVRRTIAWAKRCKAEFEKLAQSQEQRAKSEEPTHRRLLFGVIQGGGSRALRKECAEALLEIGFDGFGYGGWPLDSAGNLLSDIVSYTRELVPRKIPMHALGIGHPQNVVACVGMGYEIFDCAMPTRDARHGRLYAFNDDPTQLSFDDKWFSYVYVADDKFLKTNQPVSEFCDCPACQRYSRGYLHHLYHIKDAAFLRLATLHNLRFMAQLVERLAQ